jgi:hypothetical protein
VSSQRPVAADTPSPEHLALAARYRVALLLTDLAHLRLREYERRQELAEFLERPEATAAAVELAQLLERLSQGER